MSDSDAAVQKGPGKAWPGAELASGNKPQADNKQETVTVDEEGSFPVRNGRTNVSFDVTPLSTLTCPGNQPVVIEALTWDLVLSGERLNIPITGSA